MAGEEGTGGETPVDRLGEDIRRGLVRRVAQADRDEHRDIYDALEHECSFESFLLI